LVRKHGASITIIVQDLVKPEAIPHIVERLETLRRVPDILINCAGFATYGPFEKLSIDRQRDEINVNCMAPVELTHALLPGMLQQGSKVIINVASTAACNRIPIWRFMAQPKPFCSRFRTRCGENIAQGHPRPGALPRRNGYGLFDVVNAEEASVVNECPLTRWSPWR
jgi:short-subunit dehydrogenase